MQSLFYLYSRIIINEYKKKFFSKSTMFGAAILILLSVLAVGLGFALGFIVNYSRLHPGISGGEPFYEIRIMFNEVVIPNIIIKATARTKFFRQLDLNTLRIFPLTKFKIFLFDISLGLFDYTSLYFTEMLLGLIAGAGGFSLSLYAVFLFIILCLSLVYFVHAVGELIQSIIRLFGSLPKIRTTAVLLFSFALLYFLVLKNLSLQIVINNNPLSWNINSVYSLIHFNQGQWILNVILLNIFFSLLALVLTILVKTLHADLFSAHVVQKNKEIRRNKIGLPNLALFFSKRIQPYLEKDIKYILRSSRSLSAIIIEILTLIFVCYMHFNHTKHYDTVYFPMAFLIILPTMVWDFYLSNSWGLERRGFGFYLYSNIKTNVLTPSKNIGFVLVRLPLILLTSLVLCVLFSFKYLPVIIILYFVLGLTSLSFSNLVSVKNPFPVDFKESSMSRQQQQKISWLGFVGLITNLILSAGVLFLLYKIDTGLLFYIVAFILLLLLFLFYRIMTTYSTSLLNNQKEIIYKKLIKI